MRTHLIAAALLAAAGCSGLATPTAPASTAAPAASPSPAGAPARTAPNPVAIAATTPENHVVVLDPTSGAVERTLATVRQFGLSSGLAVSPDGRTVYYSVANSNGCLDGVWSVPAAGGNPVMVAAGDLPAISPDGSQLAYVRLPAPNTSNNCGSGPSDYSIVVRQLRSGHETLYPASPGVIRSGVPMPITDLTWAADSRRLAVSILAPNGRGSPWRVEILDTGRDRYYVTDPNEVGLPVVSGPNASVSYYRDGTFLPNGNLFVNRLCCIGEGGPDATPASSLLWEVDTSGVLVHQVAIGFTNSVHSSLRSDATGRWLLYVAGRTLYVSEDGRTPTALNPNCYYAAWIEP